MKPTAPRRLRIAAIEPYAALSHRLFLEELRAHSRHEIELLMLPARAWKWRMRTASLHFASLLERSGPPDLLFVSDYTSLAELIALCPRPMRDVPAVAYFHENQLTYPLQGDERRDHHFALTHMHTMLCARHTYFNSSYHRESFLDALDRLLAHVPDVDLGPARARMRASAGVLPLGTDVRTAMPPVKVPGEPIILWNHRWEYDKDPGSFVDGLLELDRRGSAFRLRVLGQSFREVPDDFERLRRALGSRVERIGFVPERAAYLDAVRASHLTVSTARHEFFGLATLEAIRSGLFPVLPNDLAYPELLSPRAVESGLFLYERPDGLVDALERALDAVHHGAYLEERGELAASTRRFGWNELAPRYDEAFSAAAEPGGARSS